VLVAADYPFLDVFWTMILFFFWIAWIWVLIVVISDIFRRDDASGWTKALWVIFVIALPFLGVLVYLIANGKDMGERRVRDARAAQSDFDAYVRETAGSGGAAAEIEKAKQLLDGGAISQDEFERIKAKALS
jgi:Phospholipase_D-nuclease N-terminal/Short C-terminal domain